jgi:hypothetical protein
MQSMKLANGMNSETGEVSDVSKSKPFKAADFVDTEWRIEIYRHESRRA